MELFGTFTLGLLLAFLGLQVSPSWGVRGRNRGADRTVTAAPDRGQRIDRLSRPAANGRGKFIINEDKMRCSWGAKDVGDAVRLTVKCENPEARVKGGVTDRECQYNAEPQQCPGYQSANKAFWKQVARALKKLQGKVCADERALVRAGMCKRAPRHAHFKLDIHSSVSSAQSGGYRAEAPRRPASATTARTHVSAARTHPETTRTYPNTTASPVRPTNCTGHVDVRRKAEEHCSDSWVSVCSFFFSMLQSDEC